jgi:hypothetical protein
VGDYTVLHGFYPSAGQPGGLARALRSIGVDASNVIFGPNKFDYPADFHFSDRTAETMRAVLAEFGAKSDIVHIHAVTPFFTRGKVTFPMGLDLLALRAAGTRIVMHFRGSEIRMPTLFEQRSPFHYVDDDPEGIFAKFPEDWQCDYLQLCQSLCDEIVVTDPELATYVPGAKILPRVINLDQWQQVSPAERSRPLVVHAPSRPGVKGTSHVLAAVEALRDEGIDFDFRLVQGLSNAEAREIYEQADIIVDQLRIGWYGVLAVEGMALGKAVISYIRDDLVSSFTGDVPVAVATPVTIKDVLRELIRDPARRNAQASAGRAYCIQVHGAVEVAHRAAEIYAALQTKTSIFDVERYLAIVSRHEQVANELRAEAKALGARNAKKAAKNSGKSRLGPRSEAAQISFAKKLADVYRKEGIATFVARAPRRLARRFVPRAVALR